jgi:hypothetical protein
VSDYLCTLRGSLNAGTIGEIFSHSLAIQSSAEPSGIAAAVNSAWVAAWTAGTYPLQNYFGTSVLYEETTAALILDAILPDVTVSAAHHFSFPAGTAGTNASPILPTQNAVAISLTAGSRPNGAPMKGRFYLPNVCSDVLEATDGTLKPTAHTGIHAATTGFLTALQSAGHQPAVWSRKLGVLQPVQSVRVGDRIDTIRTRRNRGVENYVQGVI